MNKRKPIAETEIDTGYSLKPRRMQERFLKGPIPIRKIAQANNLPGQALSVYLAVHHQTALSRKSTITLPKSLLDQIGVSRDSKARALNHLDKAGLIRLENRAGRAARVTLVDDAGLTTAHGLMANSQWTVTAEGIRCLEQDYPILKSQLAELRDPFAGISMWPLQMAAKSWVDIEAFIAVFDRGLDILKPEGVENIDRSASYAQARQLAAERKAKNA